MRALRREVAEHNAHCWLAALGALLAAWLAWACVYAAVIGPTLLFETIRKGEAAAFPWWLHPVVAGVVVALLGWGALDAWARRFRPPPDHPVVGWHLLPDFVLLPARLTFAITDHLAARIHPGREAAELAWQVLQHIADAGRVLPHTLGGYFRPAGALGRALRTLELLGWIDLHASEEGAFYRIRSAREEELAGLKGITTEAGFPGRDVPE